MWRYMYLSFMLTFVLTAAALSQQLDSSRADGTIIVTITSVRTDDGGNLLVSLFDNEKSWLKLEEALAMQVIPADSDTVIVVFDSLFHGDYALSVIHDKNENGKFDMRWFPWPKPKEGSGVSNNHRRKGKPKYDEALFSVESDETALSVEMVY